MKGWIPGQGPVSTPKHRRVSTGPAGAGGLDSRRRRGHEGGGPITGSGRRHRLDTPRLTFEAYQEAVHRWVETIGVRYFSELTNTAVLMEEVGEVARIMARAYGDQSPKEGEGDADLADELADVVFVVACIANQTGIDLAAALERNLEKKTRRDRDRHRRNPKLAPPDPEAAG